jgi:hypothetical protein
LQTATNPHDYRIPDAGDELQIDHNGFQLKGWIAPDDHFGSGIDEQDPWSGAIRYPPTRPAQFVVNLMNLKSDSERRVWYPANGQSTIPVLWSQVWGHYNEKEDGDEEESGRRIQASPQFITDFLRKVDMDLIVEVEMERRYSHSRYESRKEDSIGFIPGSARLFLIKSDGKLFTI